MRHLSGKLIVRTGGTERHGEPEARGMSEDANNYGNSTKEQGGERTTVADDGRFHTLADIRIRTARVAHNLAAVPLSGIPAAAYAID